MRATIRKPYPVFIGNDLLRTFDFSKFPASRYVVITDAHVDRLLFKQLRTNRSLPANKLLEIIVPPGEESKTMHQADSILRRLAEEEIDRGALILAFGGGVVGDLSGFVASVYKRGIGYLHLPTTLLAQVDSSLGGKTAINLTEGKNLVGSTYNPRAVVTDISLLTDLPQSELVNGLAELIKYGMIYDSKLFQNLESSIDRLLFTDYKKLVARAAGIKLAITQQDPNEKEYRKILNYGHTLAHAYEIASNYRLSHGQAVALGMIGEGFMARALGILPAADLERQNALIRVLQPPFSSLKRQFSEDALIELMYRDKKAQRGRLYFVLPRRIGQVYQVKRQVAFPVAEHAVRKSLRYVSSLSN